MSKYTNLSLIGEGGSAWTYTAQAQQGRVLIKRFKSSIKRDRIGFHREAEVLKSLSHPQIPRYIESYVEEVNGLALPHLVQEYVVGENLDQYIKSHMLSTEDIWDWIGQILGILSYLHGLHPPVIHRDIKPSNIMLREGQVVLIDFGLAVDQQHRTMGHTMAVGTLGYQSPEQISGQPTCLSDLYSVGALAVELLTGHDPSQLLKGARLVWQDVCLELPTKVQEWLDRMLAEDPEQRFSSVVEAFEKLPISTQGIQVMHAAHRVPDGEGIPKNSNFMAMRQARLEQKRKAAQAERKALHEKAETERQAEREAENRRIAYARRKQRREEICVELRSRANAICAELEGAWELGIADISSQNLRPEELLNMIHESFHNEMCIQLEDVVHIIHHPIFELSDHSTDREQADLHLGYLKWILEQKCSAWSEQSSAKHIQERLEHHKLQQREKEKEIADLSFFASLWRGSALNKELKEISSKVSESILALKKEEKDYFIQCMQVFWTPFFDVAYLSLEKRARSYRAPDPIFGIPFFPDDIEEGQTIFPPYKGFSFPFVGISSGSFKMGALESDRTASDRSQPQHEVTISKGFWLSKYPVTQALYTSVMGRNPSAFKGASHPVEGVSWCDAILFCNRLSELEGLKPCYVLPEIFDDDNSRSKKIKWDHSANGYRLPTEAEWEYSARGGESFSFAGSDHIDEVAWYSGNSGYQSQPVGQKKANGYGLYDMTGNVSEWVWDSDLRPYMQNSIADPIYVKTSSHLRVRRGGGWDTLEGGARIHYRIGNEASYRSSSQGFRILRPVLS